MAPGATEATADQTATKPSNSCDLTAPPRVPIVYAVAWRRPDPRTGRPRRITAYRPTIEQARRVAAGAAEVSTEPPVIFATPTEWAVTS